MEQDEIYMQRAIQLAKCGESGVAPNPMVGAVIVKDGRILGEGYHRKYGGPHAEVNAVASVPEGQSLEGSVMYVTLEPCSHWGKTPPCCDMIIKQGISRVVIGMQDPNAKVNGEGIHRMREAGLEVTVGVLEEECRSLNPCFLTYHEKGRPRITLKWAQTPDGVMGYSCESGRRLRVSTSFTQMLVHRLRSRCQAIMVGTNTAIHDNPLLDTRYWRGKSPLKVTIDRKGRLDSDIRMLAEGEEAVVYHNEILSEMLYDLHKRGVQHLLVEGGSKLLQSFIDSNLWDEARVEIGRYREGNPVSVTPQAKVLAPVIPHAELAEEHTADGNKLLILLNT